MKTFDPDTLSQALAEPSRRAILENLRHGQKSVSELVQFTGLKQPNVSNHLAKLRQQGIVRAERIGRQVFYALATPYADLLLRLHEAAVHPLQPEERGIASPAHYAGDQRSLHAGDGADAEAASSQHPSLHAWRQAYVQSLLTPKEDRAITLVNAMLAERMDMQTIYTHIFEWALVQVGEQYAQGEIDEAQEHIASAITERMMARVAHFYSPLARAGRRATLGCVAGNWHTLGLRMLADGLRTLGWETFFIGANVPTISFLAMVVSSRPDLVVVSCAIADQIEETRHLVRSLAKARDADPALHYKIIVGGHIIQQTPEILNELPVDFAAHNLPQFLNTVRLHFPDSPH